MRGVWIVIAFLGLTLQAEKTHSQIPDIRYVDYDQLKPGTRLSVPEIWFKYAGFKVLVNTETNEKNVPLHNGLDSLRTIHRFLEFYPNLVVELSVHTDCRGSDKYSVRYSQRRAEALVDSLIEWGIHRKRLLAKGYEKELPIIPCEEIEAMKTAGEQEMSHQINRRVELKIVAMDYKKPEYMYQGFDGHRHIDFKDELKQGDQFIVKVGDDLVEHYSHPSIELEELFKKLKTCEKCAFELICSKSKYDKNMWEIRSLESLIYLQMMNKDQCKVTLSSEVEDSMVVVKVSEDVYDKPFLLFKGQRAGRSIYKDDTLKQGDEFIIDVTFDFDKAFIRPGSKKMLNWLGEKLTVLDTFDIVIESHTDCRGHDYYNGTLSRRRARSVARYLIDNYDFPQDNIIPMGMGEKDPLSELSCEEISRLPQKEAEEIHLANRRTVVKIKFAKLK